MKQIEIKNLKTYINVADKVARAVDNVSFHINKGETLAIVGESGCGKTLTSLSILDLIPKPECYINEGEILLEGIDILKLSNEEKRQIRGKDISMIFQEPMTSLNPVMTIGNQIMETILTHKPELKDKAKDIAIDMLSKVRLPRPEDIMAEYPHSLSGGMRQRVMIAMALILKPKLLIADEPTTALDVTVQAEILKLIKELKDEMKMSVLLVSHNMALIYENADRVIVMYGGKIVEEAPTIELFKNPKHPYTKSLIASIPDVTEKHKPLNTIKGFVPQATDYNIGCRFAGRCTCEMKGCMDIEPIDFTINNHKVNCHLYDDEFLKTKESEKLVIEEKETSQEKTYKDNISDSSNDKKEIILNVQNLKVYFPIRKGILKNVVSYNKAVDDISFKIRKGTTHCLVGESGSGKMTVARALLRLTEAQGGQVTYNYNNKEQNINTLSDNDFKNIRKDIQIIFQDPFSSLNPKMTVEEIIKEGLVNLYPLISKEEANKKVIEALEKTGLTRDIAKRYPHEFSGGQRQRIGIARVLIVAPKLIICDEATSALDVSIQAQIINLLKEIQLAQDISILFITHDLSLVKYIAEDVSVMKEGKIVEQGTVDEIFLNPKNEYTKTLLSSIPQIKKDL